MDNPPPTPAELPTHIDSEPHAMLTASESARDQPRCSGPEPLVGNDPSGGRPPTISVLVLNLNGRQHLETCLPSLEAQTYPNDRFEIVVVDNGSTDGSLAFVRDRHPRARIISYGSNRGFAEAYNIAARFCETEFIAFLNNDARVAPDWLAELIAATARHGASCAASRILDWAGERIDFAGGIVSLVGHCWQRDAGQPAAKEYGEDRLLFACGGSMLVRRAAFLDAGGFDPQFFAYFEDVDLGWRLSLLGHTTVFAPKAVTYHRLHGTAGRWALTPRLRLYERNALMMIYKNYESQTLERVLPVALALALARACAHTSLDPRNFEFGGPIPARTALSPRTIAHLIGLEDFACQLPILTEKREQIQRRRRLSDAELLPLFSDPLRLHEIGTVYERTARTLISEFDIDKWFGDEARHRSSSQGGPSTSKSLSSVELDRSSDNDSGYAGGTEFPTVSAVILVAGPPVHLPECLASLRAQSYPAERREVIVVDNGSAEDPTAVVAEHYPGARVIRNASNLGFAAGNNIGLRAATGKYVAFLNDDTRVDPDWLTELVKTAQRRGATCVASKILTWDGRHIDFAGGSANFEGKGFQINHGSPADVIAEGPLLFACGAAMLVDRRFLLDTGGWDEGTFAYYEDVELGWRFWLLGEEVWFAPGAVVYHKHHGTSGRWSDIPRIRLYERNSLRILYTHLERQNLERVLPAALLLSADRILLQAGFGRADDGATASVRNDASLLQRLAMALRGFPQQFKGALAARGAAKRFSLTENLRRVGARGLLGATKAAISDTVRYARSAAARAAYLIELGTQSPAFDARMELVPAAAGAALAGLSEFLESLPELQRRRNWLQAGRRRSDIEIVSRFNDSWLWASPAARQKPHEALQKLLVETFGIAPIAGLGALQEQELHGEEAARVLTSARPEPQVPPLFRRALQLALMPFGILAAFTARLLAWPPIGLIRRGCERVCFHRLPLRDVHVVRQQTSESSPDEAIRWLGPLTIGRVTREALSCHPISPLQFHVTGWSGGRAVAWCSLLPEAWTKNSGGVEFRLAARTPDGTWERARSLCVAPRWRWGDRRWRRLHLPLPVTGGDLEVTLSTHVPPGAAAGYAWAVWGDPRIERVRPAGELWASFRGAVRLLGLMGTVRRLRQLGALSDDSVSYQGWLAANTPAPQDLQRMAEDVARFTYRPRISIVTPVYNTDPRWLQSCINSVRRQVYQDWELCLCDDGSTSEPTLSVLRESASDPRVRVTSLASNLGISASSNAALAMATGEFVAMLDHDDELPPDALYEIVRLLNEQPLADMIYSDEDKLDFAGQRCDPYFKPDWSPEHFLCCMYTCHLMAVRRSLLAEIGGFRLGFEGSQDYDLVLRVMARTSRIYHIPKVLYHWRKVEGSAAASGLAKPWAVDAARRAIAEYATQAGLDAQVEMGAAPGQFRVRHRLRARPLVSIVIAGADGRQPITSSGAALVLQCVRSMEKTDYDNYEVIVVEDGSLGDAAHAALETRRSRCMTYHDAAGTDLASRVNFGVSNARGTHIVICCDPVQVVNSEWLTALLEYSQQPAIGSVGPKLLYPDGRIRHVGVILGLNGIAALPFHGFSESSPGYISSAVGIRNYSAVSGSCMMTRRAVLDEVGGFNAAFGVHFADIDYCLRVRRAGYRIVFTPYAELCYRGFDLRASLSADVPGGKEMRRVWGEVLEGDPYYNPNLTREFVDYRPRVRSTGAAAEQVPDGPPHTELIIGS